MVRVGLLASALILSLAGCVETQQPATTGSASASAADVEPGSAAVDTMFGSMTFADVCVDTYGHPEKAKAVLLARGFVQHPQTGTFYNPRQNESFKLMGKTCSMVFGAKGDPDRIAMSFAISVASRASATPDNSRIGIDPGTGFASTKGPKGSTFTIQATGAKLFGQPLYHAVLTAP